MAEGITEALPTPEPGGPLPSTGHAPEVVDVNPNFAAAEAPPREAAPEQSANLLGSAVEQAAPEQYQSPQRSEMDAPPSIYGGLDVAWPEGMEEGLKNEPTLKPYVSEDGTVNINGALKSLVHAQKSLGSDRLRIPGEGAPNEDWQQFHEKAFGYDADINNYDVDFDPETSTLSEDFAQKFVSYAHENMYPPGLVTDVLEFLGEATSAYNMDQEGLSEHTVQENVNSLKQEWGAAFNKNVQTANSVINTFGGEEFNQYLQETGLANDPMIAKFLANIGSQVFAEGSFDGMDQGGPGGSLTPDAAQNEINAIYGDTSHPYHDKNHPQHEQASQDMLKLFSMRRGHEA